MSAPSLPTREKEQELHRRLLDGDKTASAALADAYYERLLAYLRRRNARSVSDDLIANAASQTWMNLCKNPGSYDGKRSLWTFLRMSAQGDLVNELNKEMRRRRYIDSKVDVEQWSGDGKIFTDGEQNEEVAKIRRDFLPRVQVGLTAGELRCLELHLAGERKTARFAEALGITHWPAAEQRAEVYRTKDKLKKRIERARRDYDDAS
jgi:RNA polymerase sigma factor (sigma-70 family)